jgi:hypothetical protein
MKDIYNIGDTFIVHDRWRDDLAKMREEKNGFPAWMFTFDLGEDNTFIEDHVGCLVEIVGIDDCFEQFPCYYYLRFYCEFYESLDQVSKEGFSLRRADIDAILDPIDTTNGMEMLDVN